MKRILMVSCLLALGSIASAQIPTGTWVKRGGNGALRLIMTAESAGSGLKIAYKVLGACGKPMDQKVGKQTGYGDKR